MILLVLQSFKHEEEFSFHYFQKAKKLNRSFNFFLKESQRSISTLLYAILETKEIFFLLQKDNGHQWYQ